MVKARISRLGTVMLVGLLVAACAAPTVPAAPTTAAAPAPTATRAAAPTAAPAPTAKPAPVKLTVGYSNLSVDFMSPWIAKDAGLFEKNGLDVELQLVAGGSKTMAALLAGQLQVGQLGGAEVLSATAGGADLVILGTLAPVYPYLFYVQPDIKSAQDLKGKKIGVSSIGGSADIATRVLLRRQGLDPDRDVSIISVDSHANRTAALLSGGIDGAVDDPPESAALVEHGLTPLWDLAGMKLAACNTVIVAQRSWVNANHDAAQHYVDSIVQSIARANADRPYTVKLLKTYFKSDNDKEMDEAAEFFLKEVTAPLPYPRPEQFVDALTVLGEKNPRLKGFDVKTILDPSFVQSAGDRGLNK